MCLEKTFFASWLQIVLLWSQSSCFLNTGDGECDDENNNCGCEWDGGDCCGNDVHTTYCDKCACLDPNFNITIPTSGCTPACGATECGSCSNIMGADYKCVQKSIIDTTIFDCEQSNATLCNKIGKNMTLLYTGKLQ